VYDAATIGGSRRTRESKPETKTLFDNRIES
jgi:hypothetical protein